MQVFLRFPEVDLAGCFVIEEAKVKLNAAEVGFLEELVVCNALFHNRDTIRVDKVSEKIAAELKILFLGTPQYTLRRPLEKSSL